MNKDEYIIRKKYKNKAKFRIVGNDYSGRKLVISNTSNKTLRQLKKIESKLENIFDVEIVNFV